jgi:basic membrane lipoprotein Med (substrate-binding protein (PBP1-ABC) superfamily)
MWMVKKLTRAQLASLVAGLILATACTSAAPAGPTPAAPAAPTPAPPTAAPTAAPKPTAAPTQAAPTQPAPTATAAAQPAAQPAGPPVKVALVLPGNINDLSWNQQAYEAAKRLEQEGLIELAYTEQVPEEAAQVQRVAGGYANNGYQLIIAHSFGYQDAIFELAQQFPKTAFAWGGGIGKTSANVADYAQPFYEAYYLAGILAGGVTQSGVLGGMAGFDIPVCHAELAAFEQGAKTVRPDAHAVVTYVGDWIDVAKSKQAAEAQANQGADVFASCGEGPALGQIALAKDKNLAAVGYVGDMSPIAPQNVMASVVWNLYPLWKQMVMDVKNGSFSPAKYYDLRIKDDGLMVQINPAFDRPIPDNVMAKYKDALAQIKAGQLQVPYVPS